MLRNAQMIHVIGATELEDLKRRAPGQRMIIIPNGYAPGQLPLPEDPRVETDPPAVMFCGRLEIMQKGLDLLLKGFALYRKNGGMLRLVMIGGGKDSAYLRSLAGNLGIAAFISWTGVLSGDELRTTLLGGVALVHTSRFDVLPTACLEACALGVPLFVSRETNFADYILPRNAGWIYHPNVPEQIAATLALIENTPAAERIAMGKRAHTMIAEELRWDLLCQKFGQATEDCIHFSQVPAFETPHSVSTN